MPEPLESRVVRAAEAALADHKYVSPIDVLTGMGLLSPGSVQAWRNGRLDFLERTIQGSPQKISSSFEIFHRWAQAKGLQPSETRYARRTREGTAELRFTINGDPAVEKVFRTHFLSPAVTGKQRDKLQEKVGSAPAPVVFEIVRDSECSECGVELPKDSFLLMEAGQPLCLACARLDDLEYLPSGDTALTRRSTKYSTRSAVVVRFSRSRGRYERQGILVEKEALEKAEHECVADADDRAAARARGAEHRREQDRELVTRMVEQIRILFPGCPPKEAHAIAAHTAVRGSGRVGRSAAGQKLEERALTAAVAASVRHNHSNYDDLLAAGADREDARRRVAERVQDVMDGWRK